MTELNYETKRKILWKYVYLDIEKIELLNDSNQTIRLAEGCGNSPDGVEASAYYIEQGEKELAKSKRYENANKKLETFILNGFKKKSDKKISVDKEGIDYEFIVEIYKTKNRIRMYEDASGIKIPEKYKKDLPHY